MPLLLEEEGGKRPPGRYFTFAPLRRESRSCMPKIKRQEEKE
jgi:hypothetical protein